MKKKIHGLIYKCVSESNYTAKEHDDLQHKIDYIQVKRDSFDVVYSLLRELEDSDVGIIQTLYYYKINDLEELAEEAK